MPGMTTTKGDEGPTVVVEELPRTIVRRIVKEKLSRLSSSSSSSVRGKTKGMSAGEGEGEGQTEGDGMNVHKDALLAFTESARIFIHYLSATANDICKESKRQIINAEDVFRALEEIEFPEFIDPLKASLDEFKRRNAVKRSESKSKDRKRKITEGSAQAGSAAGGEEADQVEGDGDERDGHSSE